jgi:hypothetical protein
MCAAIRSNRAKFVRAISNTRSLFEVQHGEVTLLALYDKSRGNIATFYPREGGAHG